MRSLTSFDLLLWTAEMGTRARDSSRFIFFPIIVSLVRCCNKRIEKGPPPFFFLQDNEIESGSQYFESQIPFRLLHNTTLIPLKGGKFSHRFQVRLERHTSQPRPLQRMGGWLGNSRCNSLVHFNPMSSGIRARLRGNPGRQDLHLVQCGFHFIQPVSTSG